MIRIVITAVILCFQAGCGGGIVGDRIHDYDSLIDAGWEQYNQSRYDEAYWLFLSAKEYDNERPEAYIGCGWALLRRQHPDSAIVAFRTSFDYITSFQDTVDVLCGLSGSYLARGEDKNVINLFKKHEIVSYEDVFPLKKHDFFLDQGHVEIVQAMAFYRLGFFSSSENPDPDNATYHLNQALLAPYEYRDPQSLMRKMTEYLERSKGDYYL